MLHPSHRLCAIYPLWINPFWNWHRLCAQLHSLEKPCYMRNMDYVQLTPFKWTYIMSNLPFLNNTLLTWTTPFLNQSFSSGHKLCANLLSNKKSFITTYSLVMVQRFNHNFLRHITLKQVVSCITHLNQHSIKFKSTFMQPATLRWVISSIPFTKEGGHSFFVQMAILSIRLIFVNRKAKPFLQLNNKSKSKRNKPSTSFVKFFFLPGLLRFLWNFIKK